MSRNTGKSVVSVDIFQGCNWTLKFTEARNGEKDPKTVNCLYTGGFASLRVYDSGLYI